MDGETYRTNKPSVFTVSVYADKGGILSMRVAVVGFDKILKAF